jgi:hypothetical protein
MTGLELLEKHPLSATIIREWFLEKMLESLQTDAVSEEFKDMMREAGIDDDKISTLIDLNPRMLLDVFDDNLIFIEIFLYPDNTFSCKIGKQGTTASWKTRKEAELFATDIAFDILEEKLSNARIDIIAQNGNTGEHYEINSEE